MMHLRVAGASHAVHVPLEENLLVGIALTRNSVEARSMLVWGARCYRVSFPAGAMNAPEYQVTVPPLPRSFKAMLGR